MKPIKKIYEEYNIISGLQQHQLRVAAVAWQICDSLAVKVDMESIIKACLLHDMGNIIKSDLSFFPDFVQKEGIDYWQNVKEQFIGKYGTDEHEATRQIVEELGMHQKVITIIQAIGFRNAVSNEKSKNLEIKVCVYADMRVGPHGVLSLDARLDEGEKRYNGNRKWVYERAGYDRAVKSLHTIEKQIFQLSEINPGEVSDLSIEQYLEKLQDYQI